MEHKYMTLDEIVELSRDIHHKWIEAKKANPTGDIEDQFAAEMTNKMIKLSSQLACYINNEVIGKLTIDNKVIPSIAAALMYVGDQYANMNTKNPGSKVACMAMQGMLHRVMGSQTMSVNLSDILRGDKD